MLPPRCTRLLGHSDTCGMVGYSASVNCPECVLVESHGHGWECEGTKNGMSVVGLWVSDGSVLTRWAEGSLSVLYDSKCLAVSVSHYLQGTPFLIICGCAACQGSTVA